MEKLHLSARMAAVADFVPQGAHLADVGTDHGYIPLWLLQEGRIASAVASDLREGPLQHAVASAEAAQLSDRVEFLLCDGLSPTCRGRCDTVVIAGMGGETIAGILERAPWTRDNVLLILQPQSKLDVLFRWLDQNGYGIIDACLVRDAGRIYSIYVVRGGTGRSTRTPAETYVDPLLLEKRDPLLPAYLDALIRKFQRAMDGLSRSQSPDQKELSAQKAVLDGLNAMREETKVW